jgi:hypothetical protein
MKKSLLVFWVGLAIIHTLHLNHVSEAAQNGYHSDVEIEKEVD